MFLSIIIPIYNRESYLPRLFSSIQSQDVRQIEVLLVDNASTDGSYQLCKDFAEQHSTLFPIQALVESKPGASCCRNTGLKSAHGRYVYFFDSDDEFSEGFFADMVSYIDKRPEVDLLCFRTRMLFPDKTEKVRDSLFSASVADHIASSMLSTQSFVARKTYLDQVGRWNEDLPVWNDWEMGVRLLLPAPKVEWLSAAYHKIYQHPDSLSGKPLPFVAKYRLKAMESVFSTLQTSSLSHYLKTRSLFALSLKALLQAAYLRKHDEKDGAKNISAFSKSLIPFLPIKYKAALSLVAVLSRWKIKGLWRVYTIIR